MATAATMAFLTVIALSIAAAAAQSATPAATQYNNYTVGGPAGWMFNTATNASAANYPHWAANITFNLGDYLIFNTTTNETVIQTYNLTTYQSCSTDDAVDTDTFQYGGGDDDFNLPEVISVPLTQVGPNYFFSDAFGGIQCEQGLAFGIVVHYGLGLPPSLNQPPPPPYTAPPSPSAVLPPSTVLPTGGGFRACGKLSWVVGVVLLGGGFILL